MTPTGGSPYRGLRRGRTVCGMVAFSASCLALLLAATAILITLSVDTGAVLPDGTKDDQGTRRVSRRDVGGEAATGLLQTTGPIIAATLSPSYDFNCTPPSIDNFPPNVMSLDVLRHGGLLINFAVVCYLFGVLALVCDSYFMPSLETLCSALNLSEDVAGASFMAIGGSAPELFTSIFGVFIAKGNIGVGTVIGSAVFNILCVVGLCGLLAGQTVYLTKWPLARDSMWYCVCIFCLALVILDNEVHWYESMVFLLVYAAYLVFLYFDPVIKRQVERFSACVTRHEDEEEQQHIVKEKPTEKPTEETAVGSSYENINSSQETDGQEGNTSESEGEEEKNTLSPFILPSGGPQRFIWVMSFPASLMFYLTIPNCSLKRWQRWYPLTFVLALVWIGLVTYVLVWMVTILGYVLSLPDAVMGLTLLAAGSSTPDTILSVIAARNGYGDMAISHSIGSNIFDILLGLGLPWFFHSTFVHRGSPVQTYSDGLTVIVGMLLITVIAALLLIKVSSFRLNKANGVVFIVLYIVFVVPAILLEMNVIIKGLVLPQCPRSKI
ncbi:sodium/potassium/calcium exchanger 3-like isoform X1 [Asterias rubens]|uniref:sodium/potassium/calcium exchanger 3-like isoform X1 n=1 Tax=Asterias rubens TaxID=7604 RepID=UPI00145507AB|nr:sodium/potassium/calcium exchanger 3-like isoform X1 [Asterias rubens]